MQTFDEVCLIQTLLTWVESVALYAFLMLPQCVTTFMPTKLLTLFTKGSEALDIYIELLYS